MEKRGKGNGDKRRKKRAEERWEGSKSGGSISAKKWETSEQRKEDFIPKNTLQAYEILSMSLSYHHVHPCFLCHAAPPTCLGPANPAEQPAEHAPCL